MSPEFAPFPFSANQRRKKPPIYKTKPVVKGPMRQPLFSSPMISAKGFRLEDLWIRITL